VAEVGFDGDLADVESAGDLAVGQAFADEGEYLELARGESRVGRGQCRAGAGAERGQHPVGDGQVQVAAAFGDGPDGVEKLRTGGVFELEAAGPGP
jgi:hypothetical protein